MYDYTPQLIVIALAAVLLVTVLVYERYISALKYERDDALDHADEAQELLSAFLAERSAARHPSTLPSNVRVLRDAK